MALAIFAASTAIYKNDDTPDQREPGGNPVHGLWQALASHLPSRDRSEDAAPVMMDRIACADPVEVALSRLSRLFGPLALALAVGGIGAALI